MRACCLGVEITTAENRAHFRHLNDIFLLLHPTYYAKNFTNTNQYMQRMSFLGGKKLNESIELKTIQSPRL